MGMEVASGSHTASDEPRAIRGVLLVAKADETRDGAGDRLQAGVQRAPC